ncbi:hypothetical protein EDD86DRAFT_218074 [Gorgonomyces haynaldii]|nr:hypothetical protein EDD86DRAFT_218074 [Gorgonomyces haynaldii]
MINSQQPLPPIPLIHPQHLMERDQYLHKQMQELNKRWELTFQEHTNRLMGESKMLQVLQEHFEFLKQTTQNLNQQMQHLQSQLNQERQITQELSNQLQQQREETNRIKSAWNETREQSQKENEQLRLQLQQMEQSMDRMRSQMTAENDRMLLRTDELHQTTKSVEMRLERLEAKPDLTLEVNQLASSVHQMKERHISRELIDRLDDRLQTLEHLLSKAKSDQESSKKLVEKQVQLILKDNLQLKQQFVSFGGNLKSDMSQLWHEIAKLKSVSSLIVV